MTALPAGDALARALAAGLTAFLGGLTVVETGKRDLDKDAAVGLLSRSAAAALRVTFLVGVGSCGSAFRARAREAAVGAKRPEAGVLGRWLGLPAVAFDGVLGRDGVFADRDGVLVA